MQVAVKLYRRMYFLECLPLWFDKFTNLPKCQDYIHSSSFLLTTSPFTLKIVLKGQEDT